MRTLAGLLGTRFGGLSGVAAVATGGMNGYSHGVSNKKRREAAATHWRGLPSEGQRSINERRFTVQVKFYFAISLACMWVALAVVLSLPWLHGLSKQIGEIPALASVGVLAYLPGLIMAFLLFSLMQDEQPPFRLQTSIIPVTVLIAARNEANNIGPTLRTISMQDYGGPISVIVVENASTDSTDEAAREAAAELNLDCTVINEPRPGKFNALNRGLNHVTTPYLITLDADTALHSQAIQHIVARLESSLPDVAAVAGSVLVKNVKDSFWTRMQEWDYFLGIASVKRMQGMFQSTLVAQGGFSVYRTERLRVVNGWSDSVGEDIVLTWELLHDGHRVIYEPTAVAFTSVPVGFRSLVIQRERWARGMFEAIHAVHPWRQHRGLTRAIATIDLFIPWIDAGYTLLWMPGLVLAAFGIFWFVGFWTLFVLPLTLLVYALLARYQLRHVMHPLGLRLPSNRLGFIAYLVVYQFIMSPASLVGYFKYVFRLRRRWS